MDPNAAEPGNQGGVAVADKQNPVDVKGEQPVNTDPSLANLEGVVAAAQQAAAASPVPQTPAETPEGQFMNQFGSGPETPPVAEVPVSVAPLDPSINTVDDLLARGPQTAESKKTPAEELKEDVSVAVEKFLEEVTKEKVAA